MGDKPEEIVFGIDLGGTKIEGVVLRYRASSEAPFEILARERIPTEASEGYEHIVERCVSLCQEIEKRSGSKAKSFGFGTPGVLDPQTSTMKNCNTTCLNDNTLKKDLYQKLGRPVQLANDANCFALAEARLGAGRGANCVFGVILGTGVGGGIVLQGRVHEGLQGIGGEWGHNVLDPSGPNCYCGKSGCVETLLAGPSLEKWWEEKTGKSQKLADIFSNTAAGELEEFRGRICTLFGQAISVVINILDPDKIVLGGGVSNLDFLYDEGREAAKHFVFNNRLETAIVKNELGDSAGVFGAAMLTI